MNSNKTFLTFFLHFKQFKKYQLIPESTEFQNWENFTKFCMLTTPFEWTLAVKIWWFNCHKCSYLLMAIYKHIYTINILSSIVHTFLHWKWCWNIPCALYMEGSWERVKMAFMMNKLAMIIFCEIILEIFFPKIIVKFRCTIYFYEHYTW